MYLLAPAVSLSLAALAPTLPEVRRLARVFAIAVLVTAALSTWGLVGLERATDADRLILDAPGLGGVVERPGDSG